MLHVRVVAPLGRACCVIMKVFAPCMMAMSSALSWQYLCWALLPPLFQLMYALVRVYSLLLMAVRPRAPPASRPLLSSMVHVQMLSITALTHMMIDLLPTQVAPVTHTNDLPRTSRISAVDAAACTPTMTAPRINELTSLGLLDWVRFMRAVASLTCTWLRLVCASSRMAACTVQMTLTCLLQREAQLVAVHEAAAAHKQRAVAAVAACLSTLKKCKWNDQCADNGDDAHEAHKPSTDHRQPTVFNPSQPASMGLQGGCQTICGAYTDCSAAVCHIQRADWPHSSKHLPLLKSVDDTSMATISECYTLKSILQGVPLSTSTDITLSNASQAVRPYVAATAATHASSLQYNAMLCLLPYHIQSSLLTSTSRQAGMLSTDLSQAGVRHVTTSMLHSLTGASWMKLHPGISTTSLTHEVPPSHASITALPFNSSAHPHAAALHKGCYSLTSSALRTPEQPWLPMKNTTMASQTIPSGTLAGMAVSNALSHTRVLPTISSPVHHTPCNSVPAMDSKGALRVALQLARRAVRR